MTHDITNQIGTNGTVTNGAVNFAQLCLKFANTISYICANLRTFRAHFAQIRPISRKFCKICMFPHFFDLHPCLLHPRLFRSKPSTPQGLNHFELRPSIQQGSSKATHATLSCRCPGQLVHLVASVDASSMVHWSCTSLPGSLDVNSDKEPARIHTCGAAQDLPSTQP